MTQLATLQPSATPLQRTCSNCACTETPLWRRSPLGPKTLCNACGVRMKKGRLQFVPNTGRFITVESPAAAAKRQKKERQRLEKEAKQNISTSASEPAPASGGLMVGPRGVGKSSRRKQHAFKSPAFKGGATGMYYLLAAIDFVETS